MSIARQPRTPTSLGPQLDHLAADPVTSSEREVATAALLGVKHDVTARADNDAWLRSKVAVECCPMLVSLWRSTWPFPPYYKLFRMEKLDMRRESGQDSSLAREMLRTFTCCRPTRGRRPHSPAPIPHPSGFGA
nr:hypothetical protein CFP56_20533 [Quercus suber]